MPDIDILPDATQRLFYSEDSLLKRQAPLVYSILMSVSRLGTIHRRFREIQYGAAALHGFFRVKIATWSESQIALSLYPLKATM